MADKEAVEASIEMDREVIRCQVCGLVQYRTRTGNCRRCLRLLPPKVTFVIPTPSLKICRGTTGNCSRTGQIVTLLRTSASGFDNCGSRAA